MKKRLFLSLLAAACVTFSGAGAMALPSATVEAQAATNLNGVCKAADGNWYYYKNGVVQHVDTVAKNQYGWWRIENGKVNFNSNTVAKNEYGWWVIQNGKVNFSYNGLASNENGTWYCTGGKVQFGANDVVNGTVNGKNGWWLVRGGKVTYATTVAKNVNGWWLVEDGMVNFNSNTVAKNEYGWWVIQNGKVNFSYNGIASNENGTWKITNGKVTFNDNGVIKVGNDWYNFVGSRLTPNTVAKNTNGWWYIDGSGKVDFTFNGVAENQNGLWLIKNGKVDFNANGTYEYADEVYRVVNGRAEVTHIHDYSSKVTKEVTCTEDGTRTYTCSGCGDTYTEVIPAFEHNYSSAVTKEATCTEDGTRTYTCTVCGDTYTEAIPATGHSYDEGVVTKEPTCAEEGVITYTCTVCGETCTEAIPATEDHDWTEVTERVYSFDEDLVYDIITLKNLSIKCNGCGEIFQIPDDGDDLFWDEMEALGYSRITKESANALFNVYLQQAADHLKDCPDGDAGLKLEWDETVITGYIPYWTCNDCINFEGKTKEEATYYSLDELEAHFWSGEHGASSTWKEPVYETIHHSAEASYEDVITGYKCIVCGAEKQ